MQYHGIPFNTMEYHSIPCDPMQYHTIPCNTMQYHAIPCNTMQYHTIPCHTMQYHGIPCNTMQYHAIPCNTMQYYAIPCSTMQYCALRCNTMQYHASLITADGAYHCPVSSIRPFLKMLKRFRLLPGSITAGSRSIFARSEVRSCARPGWSQSNISNRRPWCSFLFVYMSNAHWACICVSAYMWSCIEHKMYL